MKKLALGLTFLIIAMSATFMAFGSRLPVPGFDDDVYATILNDYLLVSHQADGTLETSIVDATNIDQTDAFAIRSTIDAYSKSQIDTAISTAVLDNATAIEILTHKTLTSPVINNGIINSGILTTPQINDTSSDHQYIFAPSELTTDITVTLPLLTGNDEFVFKDYTQTLAHKTLTKPVLNNITAITFSGSAWPCFSVNRNNVDQAIPDSSLTKVLWTTEDYDTNANFSSSRFTPTVPGKYSFYPHLEINSLGGSGKGILVRVEKNGVGLASDTSYNDSAGTRNTAVDIYKEFDMNGSSDYIEIFILHDHGTSRDLAGEPAITYFVGCRVS